MRIYKRFENATFENFIANDVDISCLKKPRELKSNVVIVGGVGTGKTHLAYAIVNQEAEKVECNGIRFYRSNFVEYTTVKSVIDDIKRCWAKDSDKYDQEAVENYKTVPLLIIDEVGVQYGSDSERVELFEIFNERYNNMLPTIVISNLNKKQIEKTLGLRITDRIFGGAKIIELKGSSYR